MQSYDENIIDKPVETPESFKGKDFHTTQQLTGRLFVIDPVWMV